MGQKVVTFGAGQELFRQGETGGELYFVQKGKVELTVFNKDSGESAVVATISEKAVLGTMSFMEGEPRSATAKALTDVECIIVTQVQREKMLAEIPTWFKILVKDLSGNLRQINAKYIELQNLNQAMERKIQALMRKTGEKSEGK